VLGRGQLSHLGPYARVLDDFDVNGFIIEARTEEWYFLLILFLLRDSPEIIPCSLEPNIPFAPHCNFVSGQISNDFSRIDGPRGHSDGHIVFPWDLNTAVQSVGTLKHTLKRSRVRHSPPTSGLNVHSQHSPEPYRYRQLVLNLGSFWQGAFVCSLDLVSHGAYILSACCRDPPDAIRDPAQQFFGRSRVRAPDHRRAKGAQHHHHANTRIPSSYNSTELTSSHHGH
jgi:hypothetical protein